MSKVPLETEAKQKEFNEIYNNLMQIKANVIDANTMIIKGGRAIGKTTSLAPRLTRVAYDMPGELSFFAHKTYIALLSNIIPNLIAEFRRLQGDSQKPMLREGIDFVIGKKILPDHFLKPRFPVEVPQHSLIFSNGHHIRLVASDQPESAAGGNAVHIFIEEMKHNKGDRLKTRLFPTLRGGTIQSRKSHYYEGITGISDAARVDLGEDDWFEEYKEHVNEELIQEIVTASLHVNKLIFENETYKNEIKATGKDQNCISTLNKKIIKNAKNLQRWQLILRDMRKTATYFLEASTFVNKDFLGINFFRTQLKVLTMDEFMVAIGNITRKAVKDMFFSGFNNITHCFDDSYKYTNIMQFNIQDTFKLTADYLKYYDPKKPLLLGYDPGHFSSIVVGQENSKNELRIIKEFYCWIPKQQGDLARMIFEFFGLSKKNKNLKLYYDRAGNKRKFEQEKVTTDARLLRKELVDYGFSVEMKSEKQRTIFYYEHFKLLNMILAEKMRSFPKLRVDENTCPKLKSAIFTTSVDRSDGKVAMDKKSERLVPIHLQAGLTPQLPSALTYLIFGLYSNLLPREISNMPDMPTNFTG